MGQACGKASGRTGEQTAPGEGVAALRGGKGGYVLYYHSECKGFYGRGWSAYAMLKHAGKEFTVKAPVACPAGSGFAPPMLQFPDGTVIAQSNAIDICLGQQLGLGPKDEAEDARCQQLVADRGDLMTEMAGGKPAERINKWLDYLQSKIQANGYFSSSGLGYADFAFYPVLTVLKLRIASGRNEGVTIPEKISKFMDLMDAVPAVKEMNASGIPLVPPTMIEPQKKKLVLYYHSKCEGFYGRGWAPYAMMKHTNQTFEVKAPEDCPAGTGFAPPMLSFADGTTIAQTNAISICLGKHCGLAPSDENEDARCQQLVADHGDFFGEMVGGKPVERVNKWLEHLEAKVQENGYLTSFGLSYVDFAFFPVFTVLKAKIDGGKIEGVAIPEKLGKWYEAMEAIPTVKEMTASGIPILPPSMQ